MSFIETFSLKNSTIMYLYSERDSIQLDPHYQRMGGVWTLEKKQLLIDSIINDYDVPKLYFHEFTRDQRKTIGYDYAVVDGRQRLQAIWEFVDGLFSLSKDFEYQRDSSMRMDGLTYEDIAKEYPKIRIAFDSFVLPVVCISTDDLKAFFALVQDWNNRSLIQAYHDIGDGGLLATVAEMMFASRLGVALEQQSIESLFAEEIGAVVQLKAADWDAVQAEISASSLKDAISVVGRVNSSDQLTVNGLTFERAELQRAWAEVSHQIQRLRDNVETADQEFALISDQDHKGLIAQATFDLNEPVEAPFIATRRPNMAILREQGVNGHVEMAAAFDKVGFNTIDVHMSDLLAGRVDLQDFEGLVACGGFSYGDVMGAGGGWAKSVLFNPKLRDQFESFFHRDSTFSLGICNGCQMLSQLAPLIPGADAWPRFHRNVSEVFEARSVNVRVEKSVSVLLQDMQGSILPIAVAHGEGRVVTTDAHLASLNANQQVTLRYVDSLGNPTQHYPLNPNGSPEAVTGVTSKDGRATIMMPHPERNFRAIQHSWSPENWTEDGAWLRMFRNARKFIG